MELGSALRGGVADDDDEEVGERRDGLAMGSAERLDGKGPGACGLVTFAAEELRDAGFEVELPIFAGGSDFRDKSEQRWLIWDAQELTSGYGVAVGFADAVTTANR